MSNFPSTLTCKHPSIPVGKAEIVFGRHPKCGVVFPSTATHISARHCRVFIDVGAVHVQDLSSNGTFINGEKIGKNQHRLLRSGDIISFVSKNPVNGKS
jgi:pSer/pThr/pTyr-binding forkhead associated (FHA) protein